MPSYRQPFGLKWHIMRKSSPKEVTNALLRTLYCKQAMKNENYILDIAADLANVPVLLDGPAGVLKRIKSKFRFLTTGKAQRVELNPNLTRYDYSLQGDSQNIRLSFLFHGLSQRWYIDSVRPQF